MRFIKFFSWLYQYLSRQISWKKKEEKIQNKDVFHLLLNIVFPILFIWVLFLLKDIHFHTKYIYFSHILLDIYNEEKLLIKKSLFLGITEFSDIQIEFSFIIELILLINVFFIFMIDDRNCSKTRIE
jgi:hypothetical protein